MPRLFAGLELPAHVRETLARLRQPLAGAKWVEADSLHLTLRFAGDIDNHRASELAACLAAVSADAFPLRLSGLGAFGGNDPRAIWIGAAAEPRLEALARAVERATRSAGLPPEGRSFKPHVTLARLRHANVDAVASFLGRHGAFAIEPFLVERFVLYSSRPIVGGGPYVVEESYPLAGGAHLAADGEPGGW